jgi:WD40 repeat protein
VLPRYGLSVLEGQKRPRHCELVSKCRYPGHPDSIDSLVSFDNDTILTGSGDGCVRVLAILPNKLLGVLGTHGDEESIVQMCLSHDKRVLATVGHDEYVQLWRLDVLHDDDDCAAVVDDDDVGVHTLFPLSVLSCQLDATIECF